jgi:hypothetical protein
MEIVPYVGEQQLTASAVIVKVNPADRRRVADLITRTKQVELVDDNNSFSTAKRLAGEAKALINEIEASKKAAKQPFRDVAAAIDQLVVEVGNPLVQEHIRLLAMLNFYVSELERKAQEEEKRRAEAQRLKDEETQRQLQAAAQKVAQAELEARQAKDEAARLRAQQEAQARQLALAQVLLDQQMDAEIAGIGDHQPKPALVPGGRVDHPWKFELVDVLTTIQAGRLRLLKWTLDIRACQDAVREQLEDKPNDPPILPGIRVWQEISVSVKASARIENL